MFDNLNSEQASELKNFINKENGSTSSHSEQPKNFFHWQRNLAFGAIPTEIIDCVKLNSDDWLIKLRALEDLEYVFDNL